MCEERVESKKICRHLKTVHLLDRIDRAECNDCRRVFPNLNSFHKHFKSCTHALKHNQHNYFDAPKNETDLVSNKDDFLSNEHDFVSDDQDFLNGRNDFLEEEFFIFENQDCEIENYYKLIEDIFNFSLTLNTLPIPRKYVQLILDKVEFFISNAFLIVLEMVSKFEKGKLRKQVCKMKKEFEKMFYNMCSEHRRTNYYKKNYNFVLPEKIVVGNLPNVVKNNSFNMKNATATQISLKKSLKNFFSLGNVLDECLKNYYYLKKSQNDVIENMIQTDFWIEKTKALSNEDVIFPLLMFYDDFETGNALGSHSSIQKLGAVYFSVPIIPYKYLVKLENIFVTDLFYTADLKNFGHQSIFSRLLLELKELESEGLTFFVNGEKTKIIFVLNCITGDNLGLNTLLGFNSSFNSNYYCRFCKNSKAKNQKMIADIEPNSLRNKVNYDKDVSCNNNLKSGIKSDCVFNELNFFHVVDNYCVDIMHDLLEGVFCHNIVLILNQLILVEKKITIDILNSKIFYFDYKFEKRNKPPNIILENIQKGSLKLSASETLCLIKYAGLIFGDLVPKKHVYWELYIVMREILEIVLSHYVTKDLSLRLKQLVTIHHELYLKLSSKNLTPKHHFMLHYPDCMLNIGPLRHVWAMRFESKHRELKNMSSISNSKINTPFTIAMKSQLKNVERFGSNKGLLNIVEISKILNFEQKIYQHKCNNDCKTFLNSGLKTILWFKQNNITFEVGNILEIPITCDLFYGQIKDIFVNCNNEILLFCNSIQIKKFSAHYYAFEFNIVKEVFCIKYFDHIHPVVHTLVNEKYLLSPKHVI